MNSYWKFQLYVVNGLFKILKKNSLDRGDILPQPRNMNSFPVPLALETIDLCYLIIKDTMKDEKHNSL